MVSIEDVARLARIAGFAIDPAHLPGVAANLAILRDRTALFTSPPIDPSVEPAAVFVP